MEESTAGGEKKPSGHPSLENSVSEREKNIKEITALYIFGLGNSGKVMAKAGPGCNKTEQKTQKNTFSHTRGFVLVNFT